MIRCFQRYIVHTEILSTFHTQVEYKNTLKNAIQTSGGETPIPSLQLRECEPCLIHPFVDWSHSPPQMTAQSVHALSHNYATRSLLVTMGCSTFTPKTAPYPLTIFTSSNTPIPWLTPLTTPNGIQIQSLFCHGTPSRQTDWPTDRWARWQACTNTRLCSIILIESDVGNNV